MGQRSIEQTVTVNEYACDHCGHRVDESQAHVLQWVEKPRIVTEDPETKRPVVTQEEQLGDPLVLCRRCIGPLAAKLRGGG